jgi:hypothetical protein
VDRGRFDALTRLVGTTGSRRTALGALLGTLALGEAAYAKGGKHHHHKGQRSRGGKRVCYPGDTCVPGTARTNTRCDFSNSNVFRNLDAQSSNLSGSNFSNADLSGADLRAVNLSDTCLVNTDLTGAIIDESTNFHRALFCNTTMPDGSVRNAGCDHLTGCCPCAGPTCLLGGGSPDCDKTLNHTCSVFNKDDCCGLQACFATIVPGLTVCSYKCNNDGDCQNAIAHQDVQCRLDGFFCPFQRCCQRKTCTKNSDCFHGGTCCPNGLCAVQSGGQAFCN